MKFNCSYAPFDCQVPDPKKEMARIKNENLSTERDDDTADQLVVSEKLELKMD